MRPSSAASASSAADGAARVAQFPIRVDLRPQARDRLPELDRIVAARHQQRDQWALRQGPELRRIVSMEGRALASTA